MTTRRIARLCGTLALSFTLALSGSAAADITPTRDASAVAAAITDPLAPGVFGAASFAFIPPAPTQSAECANGIDDDFDDKIDTGANADPGCDSPTDNREQDDAPAECADGQDNDGDDKIDSTPPETADPGCDNAQDNLELDGEPNPTAACANGVDDDGDDKIDTGGQNPDPGCSSPQDLDEGSEGLPLGADADAVAVSTTALPGFATSGSSYAILTSGRSTFADDANDSGGTSQVNGDAPGSEGHGTTVHDLVTLRIDVNVPISANCLSVDFRFLSEEFPEFLGSQFNDSFVAELDVSDFTISTEPGVPNPVSAPHNFAFDSSGKLISINTASFSEANAVGTTYDGATVLLRARTPVSPGAHSIFLSVFDQGDSILDSAAFIDNLQVSNVPASSCSAGVVSDFNAPDTAVASGPGGETTDDTPTFVFTASEPGVTFECSLDAAPFTPCTSPHTTGPLSAGAHTFDVRAIDAAGNVDPTPTRVSFIVRAAAPADRDGDGIPDALDTSDGSTPPIPGKTVNVRVISGNVYIKVPVTRGARASATSPTIVPGPQKGFVPLKGANTVPIGSRIDTEEGRIELRSAADKKGGVQLAQFYAGLFQVKQKVAKAVKLTTDIDVRVSTSRFRKRCGTSASSASSPVANAAAKRKKRSKKKVANLWADGSGDFRTTGRSSAATVRGTIWLTQERCDGTLTKVTRGRVSVRDFGRRRSVLVRAGRSYLARATRAQLRARRD